jgi:hypothetical protein
VSVTFILELRGYTRSLITNIAMNSFKHGRQPLF